MSLYAQVVVGLAVEGPFDYEVPQKFKRIIRPGSRVLVYLREKKILGYVVRLSRKSEIAQTKRIIDVIDRYPVLDKELLRLTRDVCDYYCSPWGVVIESALPLALRSLKPVSFEPYRQEKRIENAAVPRIKLLDDLEDTQRWQEYLGAINSALEHGQSVLMLLPDTRALMRAYSRLRGRLHQDPVLLLRNKPGELNTWCMLKSKGAVCALSTRSGIFAPCSNLGLIIIDEEQDQSYKQEQVPHYHTRAVALMRQRIQKTVLLFASRAPSFELLLMARRGRIEYQSLPRQKKYPVVNLINMKSEYARISGKQQLLSKYLQDVIAGVLEEKEKVLLFYNRKGFATYAACHHCGSVLKCPRCSSNLVLHFRPDKLKCRYCAYSAQPPDICPQCNAGYIRYSGMGSEKIESEINRIFPHAKVARIEQASEQRNSGADVFVATSSVVHGEDFECGLVGVISLDNALNRADYRGSEKTFALLRELVAFTQKRFFIQTYFPNHRIFQALLKNEADGFIDDELRSRKLLRLPPYKHHIAIRLRGPKEKKVQDGAGRLHQAIRDRAPKIKIIGLFPGQPPRLRGNYYWQILLETGAVGTATRAIKTVLKEFSVSGIIVTVDVDPL